MIVDVLMPKMGESITEGTIVEWKKNVGEMIAKDETLLEISTDKVDSEVPSPAEGKVTEILFEVNDVVPVGEVIAKIGGESDVAIDNGLPKEFNDVLTIAELPVNLCISLSSNAYQSFSTV